MKVFHCFVGIAPDAPPLCVTVGVGPNALHLLLRLLFSSPQWVQPSSWFSLLAAAPPLVASLPTSPGVLPLSAPSELPVLRSVAESPCQKRGFTVLGPSSLLLVPLQPHLCFLHLLQLPLWFHHHCLLVHHHSLQVPRLHCQSYLVSLSHKENGVPLGSLCLSLVLLVPTLVYRVFLSLEFCISFLMLCPFSFLRSSCYTFINLLSVPHVFSHHLLQSALSIFPVNQPLTCCHTPISLALSA